MIKIKINLLLFLIFSLVSCKESTYNISSMSETTSNIANYANYQDIHLSSLDEFFEKPYNKYYIYLYTTTCGHCNAIKQDIFKEIDNFNFHNKHNIYLFNMYPFETSIGEENRKRFKSLEDNKINQDQAILDIKTNNPEKLEDTYFVGVPSLYVIKNKRVIDLIIGDDIIEYLRNI